MLESVSHLISSVYFTDGYIIEYRKLICRKHWNACCLPSFYCCCICAVNINLLYVYCRTASHSHRMKSNKHQIGNKRKRHQKWMFVIFDLREKFFHLCFIIIIHGTNRNSSSASFSIFVRCSLIDSFEMTAKLEFAIELFLFWQERKHQRLPFFHFAWHDISTLFPQSTITYRAQANGIMLMRIYFVGKLNFPPVNCHLRWDTLSYARRMKAIR